MKRNMRSAYAEVMTAAIIDDTGTCVIMSGKWDAWTAYSNGATVAELSCRYSSDAVLVNTSNIKDSSSKTLEVGDLYYDSEHKKFYYVTLVSSYASRPNSSWIPLIQ